MSADVTVRSCVCLAIVMLLGCTASDPRDTRSVGADAVQATERGSAAVAPTASGFTESAVIRWIPGLTTLYRGGYISTPDVEYHAGYRRHFFGDRDQKAAMESLAKELNKRGILKVTRIDGVVGIETTVRVCVYFAHVHNVNRNYYFNVELEMVDLHDSHTERYYFESTTSWWTLTFVADWKRTATEKLVSVISNDVEKWMSSHPQHKNLPVEPVEPTGACRLQPNPKPERRVNSKDRKLLVQKAKSGSRNAAIEMAVKFDDTSQLESLANSGDAVAAYELYEMWKRKVNRQSEAIEMLCMAANEGYWKARVQLANWIRSSSRNPRSTERLKQAGVHGDNRTAYMWLKLAELNDRPEVRGRLRILARDMTAEEVAQAEKMVVDWKPGHCRTQP